MTPVTQQQRLEAINLYCNLEDNTALVIATNKTSATELIVNDNTKVVEDLHIMREAITILTQEDYYDYHVLPLRAKYIVHNHEIIPLKSTTVHRVDHT